MGSIWGSRGIAVELYGPAMAVPALLTGVYSKHSSNLLRGGRGWVGVVSEFAVGL